MKSDRVTEGDILGENRLLWNMLRISFALTHNEASEGNLCDTFFFFSDRGLAIGFAWIGKGLFEVMDVSGTGVFWNLNERPETLSLHCTLQTEKVALSQHVWLEVKGIKSFSVTETTEIIHLLWSLPVRSVSWPSELIGIWILQFLVDGTFREAVMLELLSIFTIAANIWTVWSSLLCT